MISLSGKYEPYYDDGNCSPSAMVICLLVESTQQLNCAKTVLNSKLYRYVVDKLFRYNGWINANVLKSLPRLNLNRAWTDREIYDFFNLSESEIREIENA